MLSSQGARSLVIEVRVVQPGTKKLDINSMTTWFSVTGNAQPKPTMIGGNHRKMSNWAVREQVLPCWVAKSPVQPFANPPITPSVWLTSKPHIQKVESIDTMRERVVGIHNNWSPSTLSRSPISSLHTSSRWIW